MDKIINHVYRRNKSQEYPSGSNRAMKTFLCQYARMKINKPMIMELKFYFSNRLSLLRKIFMAYNLTRNDYSFVRVT